MQLNNQKGEFTLLGLAVAAIASAFVLLAAQSFFTFYSKHVVATQSKSEVQRQIAIVRDRLQRDLATRYVKGVGDTEEPLKVIPGAVAGCDGIEIFRRHLDTNTVERVRYETLCRQPGCMIDTGLTFVRVTRWPNAANVDFTRTEDFPSTNAEVVGAQACIKVFNNASAVPAELLAEFNFAYRGVGAKKGLISTVKVDSRVGLTDRYEGVELAP